MLTTWTGNEKLFLSWRPNCLFSPLNYNVCVWVCVYERELYVFIGRACASYVFALLLKVARPLLFWCNLCIDAQMNKFAAVSRGLEHWQRVKVNAHVVDKQSEHHKGTIASILLPSQQTRPYKMSNEKAVAGVQSSIDSNWNHHLTTMPSLWTESIPDTKWSKRSTAV